MLASMTQIEKGPKMCAVGIGHTAACASSRQHSTREKGHRLKSAFEPSNLQPFAAGT